MDITSTTPPKLNRWLSIDLLRGYFLLVIIIDHVGHFPNAYEFFTGRGLLWVTAAEGFFFLSGMMVGLTRARKVDKVGFKTVWKKLWQRSALLYLWAVILTLLFTFWALNNDILPKGGLTDSRNWLEIIQQALVLNYNYGWSDFLPHYAWFMLLSPLAVYALVKGKYWLVIAASVLVWAFGASNFNTAWQLLFFVGMVVGYYLPEIQQFVAELPDQRRQLYWRCTWIGTAVTLFFSVTVVLLPRVFAENYHLMHQLFELLGQARWADTIPISLESVGRWLAPMVDHYSLGAGRVALFGLWFSTLFILFQQHQRWISHYFGGLLLPMGQHSLETYILHALVIFGLDSWALEQWSPVDSFIRTSLVIATVWWLVAKVLPWTLLHWQASVQSLHHLADELQADQGRSAIRVGSLSVYVTPAVAMVLIRAIRELH